MTLTLNITPELQARLRAAAAQAGMDEAELALATLQNHLPVPPGFIAASQEESELLQQINAHVSEDIAREYSMLRNLLDDEALTPLQQRRLIEISDELERLNVIRLQSTLRLSKLRGISLDELTDQLGLKPSYV